MAPSACFPRLPRCRRRASLGFHGIAGVLPSASTTPPACSRRFRGATAPPSHASTAAARSLKLARLRLPVFFPVTEARWSMSLDSVVQTAAPPDYHAALATSRRRAPRQACPRLAPPLAYCMRSARPSPYCPVQVPRSHQSSSSD